MLQAAIVSEVPVVLRWYLNGQLLVGEAKPELIRPAATPKDGGDYRVDVEAVGLPVVSAMATVTVNRRPVGVPGLVHSEPGVLTRFPLADLIGLASDPEGGSLTIEGVEVDSGSGGAAVQIVDGEIRFLAGRSVRQGFHYLLKDPEGATVRVPVTVNVSARLIVRSSTPGRISLAWKTLEGVEHQLESSGNLSTWKSLSSGFDETQPEVEVGLDLSNQDLRFFQLRTRQE